MNYRPMAFCSTIFALMLVAADDPDPTWSREFGIALDRATYAAINAGVTLFNQGDVTGCYRLYQGTLLGLGPIVKGQSDVLSAAIDAAMTEADAIPAVVDKAMALRKVLDRLLLVARKRPAPKPEPPTIAVAVKPVVPEAPKPSATVPPKPVEPIVPVPTPKPVEPEVVSNIPANLRPTPLWSRLGGEAQVKLIVSDFVFKASNDPRVHFDRGGKFVLDDSAMARFEIRLVEFFSSKTGGPLIYLGRPMKVSHEAMAITGAEFDAMVQDLDDVLFAHKVPKPEAEEVLKMVRGLRDEIVAAK